MFSMRFPRGDGSGYAPPWLKLIHAANRIDRKMFGEPVLLKDGNYTEQYEHAYVIFPADDKLTVRVSARTEYGSKVLKEAYAILEGVIQ